MIEVLGVIPARGGSKRLPGKNLSLLAGRPMLAFTCEAATTSRRLTRVVASTDDADIAGCAREHGVEVPFMRPAALADDAAPTLPVVRHLLDELLRRESYQPDVVVILQPTSPLRRAGHIDAAVDTLEATGADSVVSVVEVPHQYNPVSVLTIADGRLAPFLDDPRTAILRRQDKPVVYARNGAAVYAVTRGTVERGSLFGADCRPLIMSAEDSVDVDGELDLLLAEILIRRRGS